MMDKKNKMMGWIQTSGTLHVYPNFCQSLFVSRDFKQIVHEKKNGFYGLQINL